MASRRNLNHRTIADTIAGVRAQKGSDPTTCDRLTYHLGLLFANTRDYDQSEFYAIARGKPEPLNTTPLVIGATYIVQMYWDPECEVELLSIGIKGTIYEGQAVVKPKHPAPHDIPVWQVKINSLRLPYYSGDKTPAP